MSDDVKKIAERLYSIRIKHNLKASEFARRLDLTHPCIIKWERGQSIPKSEQLIKIYQVFGVTPNYILLGIDNAKSREAKSQ